MLGPQLLFVHVCSACGQSHETRIPDQSMPRTLPGGEVSADFCMAMGICPACCRVFHGPVDRKEMRRVLVALGWTFADPVVTKCPPGAASVPFDWLYMEKR